MNYTKWRLFLKPKTFKMKRILPIIIASAAIITMSMTSCIKDYSCTCTYNDYYGNPQTDNGTIHGTKADAKSVCNADKSSLESSNNTNVSCSVK
jgi:hypothetical protein